MSWNNPSDWVMLGDYSGTALGALGVVCLLVSPAYRRSYQQEARTTLRYYGLVLFLGGLLLLSLAAFIRSYFGVS